jgi:hypothetical protein
MENGKRVVPLRRRLVASLCFSWLWTTQSPVLAPCLTWTIPLVTMRTPRRTNLPRTCAPLAKLKPNTWWPYWPHIVWTAVARNGMGPHQPSREEVASPSRGLELHLRGAEAWSRTTTTHTGLGQCRRRCAKDQVEQVSCTLAPPQKNRTRLAISNFRSFF